MNSKYQSALAGRYASPEALALFANDFKFKTWRQLWLALAEAEQELGLDISAEQLAEMRANLDNLDYEAVSKEEALVRHDVMAHVHVFGKQCPLAQPIIHLGATSCYVGDNTDLIIMREGLSLIKTSLLKVIRNLASFAKKYQDLACLGYTHFQAAQPVSVGKRACLWIKDLMSDLKDLEYIEGEIKFLGSKGTTGTQASFMELFEGDEEKVKKLDRLVSEKMGFKDYLRISGQTYSRKLDFRVLAVLSSIAQSSHKFANDLRLLQHLKEVEEPFEKSQIGSSAMAYKRNPMRSERITALARFVISNLNNAANTAAEQWLERSLDDSANKRLAVPEAFLATDAILLIYQNVSSNLIVYEQMIAKNLARELPFMATENILMAAVKKGGDRQILHEKIRKLSMQAARRVKEEGLDNNLLELILKDPDFKLEKTDLQKLSDASLYTGRAGSQVKEYLQDVITPKIKEHNLSTDVETRTLNI